MNTLKIKKFFSEKYPQAINTKSRKREIVMQRRMIVNFLFQEGKIIVTVMKNIIGGTHQVICYFLRHVNDKSFENYYKSETEKFRLNYWELVNNLAQNSNQKEKSIILFKTKEKEFCEAKKKSAIKGIFDIRQYAIAIANRRKKTSRIKFY